MSYTFRDPARIKLLLEDLITSRTADQVPFSKPSAYHITITSPFHISPLLSLIAPSHVRFSILPNLTRYPTTCKMKFIKFLKFSKKFIKFVKFKKFTKFIKFIQFKKFTKFIKFIQSN